MSLLGSRKHYLRFNRDSVHKYRIVLNFFEYQDLQLTQMLAYFKSDSMPKIQSYTHMLYKIKHM